MQAKYSSTPVAHPKKLNLYKNIQPPSEVGSPPAKAAVKKRNYLDLIVQAINSVGVPRKGASYQAIKKWIIAQDEENLNANRLIYHLKVALQKGIDKGILLRPTKSTAVGATGYFKIAPTKGPVPVKAKLQLSEKDTLQPKKPTKRAAKPAETKTVKQPNETKKLTAKKPVKESKPAKAGSENAAKPLKKNVSKSQQNNLFYEFSQSDDESELEDTETVKEKINPKNSKKVAKKTEKNDPGNKKENEKKKRVPVAKKELKKNIPRKGNLPATKRGNEISDEELSSDISEGTSKQKGQEKIVKKMPSEEKEDAPTKKKEKLAKKMSSEEKEDAPTKKKEKLGKKMPNEENEDIPLKKKKVAKKLASDENEDHPLKKKEKAIKNMTGEISEDTTSKKEEKVRSVKETKKQAKLKPDGSPKTQNSVISKSTRGKKLYTSENEYDRKDLSDTEMTKKIKKNKKVKSYSSDTEFETSKRVEKSTRRGKAL